jgi:hypothetical protein
VVLDEVQRLGLRPALLLGDDLDKALSYSFLGEDRSTAVARGGYIIGVHVQRFVIERLRLRGV